MAGLFLIVFGIYFLFLFILLAGWWKVMRTTTAKPVKEFRFISIIVPIRNEEKTMPTLIESLTSVRYPAEKFEVILVDDHSTDHSGSVWRNSFPRPVHFTLLLSIGEGKKHALTQGIAMAKGDLIATTDADCWLPPDWLHHINQGFGHEDILMQIGGVSIRADRGLFSKLQALEFGSLIGTAAATCGLGFPILCNGANLSFRKETFGRVSGYEGNMHVASGDDEFLMRKIYSSFGPKSIRFLPASGSVVQTHARESVKAFFQQRLRWAAKWKHNSSPVTRILAPFILVFQLSWLLSPVWLLFQPLQPLLISVLLFKILLEGIFLWRVSSFLGQAFSLASLLALQVLYPLYVVSVGLLSNFLPLHWKGRRVQ